MKFIAAFGLGGCHAGYTHAAYVAADSEAEAEEKAFELAHDEFIEYKRRGISYQAFLVDGTNQSPEWVCGKRLKQSAINMLHNACKTGV